DLDIDSPYPCPTEAEFNTRPVSIPMKDTKIRATHYGRNIEKIIDLITTEPEGETKTALIRSLAVYMRQQYLIWNKDSVADETIFNDIVKLSDGRITIPEGLILSKISENQNYSRPTLGINVGQAGNKQGRNRKNNRKQNKKKGGQ
ncbi:MAG: DUF4290 domain-containing protein, partial [Bacteroidales bacterium]|nr:DUF4290 domain-containing protein [Bacteroidales bacterium]